MLLKMVVEKSTHSISLMKIFGYTNKENNHFYLNSFFITVMVFALPDYDAIMTGLRRDSVSDDAIASCLFPGSIPCWVSCCQGASWGIVDFLGDYVEPIPHEREVCDWNLGACKCVKMRGSAREKCSNLL